MSSIGSWLLLRFSCREIYGGRVSVSGMQCDAPEALEKMKAVRFSLANTDKLQPNNQ
jgi:hypothetical protein